MDFEKIIEDLKTEIVSLRIRIERMEEFLLSNSDPSDYIKSNVHEKSPDDLDSLFDEAREIVSHHDKASVSLLQRRLSIGYSRASRIMDQLEEKGILGHGEGSEPREVIKKN